MNIYNELKSLIDFFREPFIAVLKDVGIYDVPITLGMGSIEWFNISLGEITEAVLGLVIVFFFYRVIFRLIKLGVKMITGRDLL